MVRISQKLSDRDLKELKFLCGDIVSESALDEVTTPTDLFKVLQYYGHLSPESYEFMRRCLLSIGRNDLAFMLPNPQAKTSECYHIIQPKKLCELQHRMMLVSIADRLRRQDILKLVYLNIGEIIKSLEFPIDDAITALQAFAGLEDSHSLSCGNYSVLCDVLRLIGRCDLADYVAGLPRNVPTGFTTKGQAFSLKMQILCQRKEIYVLHQKKLCSLKEGCSDLVCYIHSVLHTVCIKGLSNRSGNVSSIESIQSAFDRQLSFFSVFCPLIMNI